MSGPDNSVVERIEVNEATIAASQSGAGRPILLIHAYPMRRQLYRDVIEPLSQANLVIACDNRGFGESTVTSGAVSMAQYADDLAAVLDSLNIQEPAVVAGVSMGGYIAMRLAERHPDRAAGLLLCNTRAASDTPDAAAKREALARRIEAEGVAVTQGVPEKLLGESTQRNRPELCDELRSWILDTDPRGIAAALRGMATRPDSTDFIRSFDRPIAFLAGDEDTFTPAEEMRALAANTGRPITVLDKCGHLSPIEQPAGFVAAIQSLVESL